ncbi:hypothetical protein BC6307_01295 [Sutcliffiella cohnii]|uniref:Gram-positive cocci surface proteins LPxTG domain-containing protein n=1 Tax=Sutcliffiella cohnii TaxID=33932 RepID=A0A223KKY2_9BACI|nr:hypothetical protein [Sutcliffiella cohnii]AST90013.1 hypothetical protein BC6307_01295 [Sutcliffiella cohnii]
MKWIGSMLVILMSLSLHVAKASDQSEELLEAANEGLETFKRVVAHEYAGYGYESVQQLNEAKIAFGVEIFQLDFDVLESKKYKKIREATIATDEWEFFVTSSNDVSSILRVAKDANGDYSAVSFGGDAKNLISMIHSVEKLTSIIDPLLIVIGNKYYILYETVNGKEYMMKVPEPSEFTTYSDVDAKDFGEKLLENVKKLKPGERGGIDGGIFPIETAQSKEASPIISAEKGLVSITLIAIVMTLFFFVRERYRKKES